MNLKYNGHIYEHTHGGAEGEVIKERNKGLDGYVFTNLGGRPAILFDGEFYVKREGGPKVAGWVQKWKRR